MSILFIVGVPYTMMREGRKKIISVSNSEFQERDNKKC